MHSEKVPYFILDLLQQVPSVYVHGLGRFDAIFHPAVVDVQQSRIKPPHIEPGFEADSYDAGDILPSYIHYVTGISKMEAHLAINEFVERVNQNVDSGGTFTIEKFGVFSKSTTDILHFTPDWDAFNLSFRGLEVLDIQLPVEVVPSDIETPDDVVVEPGPVIIESEYEPVIENSWVTDQEDRLAETHPEILPETEIKPEIADSTSRLWWTILAIALVLITILCAYLAWDIISNRKKINQYVAITNDSIAASNPDIIIVDTIDVVPEEIPEDTAPIVEPEPEPVVPANPVKSCYVVVGAFSNPDNVVRMEARLIEMGYTAEKITGGTLTKVAITTSCDQETLNKTLIEARKAINPEAWIY